MSRVLKRTLALLLLLVSVTSSGMAWFPHGAPYDTYLAIIMGDSNSGSGECFNATYDTLSPVTVLQLKHDFTVVRAQEPLDFLSMGTTCGTNTSGVSGQIGSTTKLVQMLVSAGKVPAYVQRIVIIPAGWAGTGLNIAGNAYWVPYGEAGCNATNKCGCALDGDVNWSCGLAAGKGLYGMLNQAKSVYPNSKIWFINMIEGANDGGMTQANWTAAAQSLFTDLRNRYPDAVSAPILWTGIPPDKVNSSLGYTVNLGNIIAAQQAIGSNIANAYYVDPSTPTVLHSYFDNAWVHFNSASHRGGVPNIITTGKAWNSGTTYNPAAAFTAQTTVLGSDGFIYTCIATTIGNDPVTDGGVHWSKQWDTTASVSESDSLAGRQYQQLIAAGF